jgi:hypothetical protein
MSTTNINPRTGRAYLYTTPELRKERQEAVAKFVEKDFPTRDTVEGTEAWRRHNAAIAAVGGTATALVAAGIVAATAHHGPATTPPDVRGAVGPGPTPAPTTQVILASDAVGQAADAAVQGTYHRQDGKKADTMSQATPAFKFRAGLGRPTESQLRTAPRVDNNARINDHEQEGIEVSGRGSGTFLFGRFYQAPEIPPVANFQPVTR